MFIFLKKFYLITVVIYSVYTVLYLLEFYK